MASSGVIYFQMKLWVYIEVQYTFVCMYVKLLNAKPLDNCNMAYKAKHKLLLARGLER